MTVIPGREALEPCPFCGSLNVDPEGWSTLPQYAKTPEERSGPACDDCGATAPSAKIWNARQLGDGAKRIEVDIGAAAQALQDSPELCAMMNEMAGGPALVEAQAEIDRLNEALRLAAEPSDDPDAMNEKRAVEDARLVANVREACAKIAEPWPGFWLDENSTDVDRAVVAVRTEIAKTIRALSTTGEPKR